jgi:transcriptional regulator with XRE-family HTH domain
MAHPVHSPAYRIFLQRLRAARAKAGLLQAEVARQLKKPQSYVSKCESGERRVDVIELVAFAKIYGLPVSFFVPPVSASRKSREPQ